MTWGTSVTTPEPTQPEQWTLPELPTLGGLRDNVELPYPTAGLNAEQIELLTVWENTKNQLKAIKDYEMTLRKCVIYDAGLFNDEKESGVEHVPLGNGYQLSGTKNQTYHLKTDDNCVALQAALNNFTEDEAAMLVTWNPSLSVGNYKKLSEDKQKHFDGVLEIRDGAPKLEIKAPKTSK